MIQDRVQKPSELAGSPATRRDFLIKASALGASTPFMLSACGPDESGIVSNGAASASQIFEMLADIAGEFVFVDHGFDHGQKGAIGIISVES